MTVTTQRVKPPRKFTIGTTRRLVEMRGTSQKESGNSTCIRKLPEMIPHSTTMIPDRQKHGIISAVQTRVVGRRTRRLHPSNPAVQNPDVERPSKSAAATL